VLVTSDATGPVLWGAGCGLKKPSSKRSIAEAGVAALAGACGGADTVGELKASSSSKLTVVAGTLFAASVSLAGAALGALPLSGFAGAGLLGDVEG